MEHCVLKKSYQSSFHRTFPHFAWIRCILWPPEVPSHPVEAENEYRLPHLLPSPLLGGAGHRGQTIVPGRDPGGKGPPRCLWTALEIASPRPSSWHAPALPAPAEPSAAASAGPPRSALRPPDSTPCLPGHTYTHVHRHRYVSRTQARIPAGVSPETPTPASPASRTPSRTPAPYTSASQAQGTTPHQACFSRRMRAALSRPRLLCSRQLPGKLLSAVGGAWRWAGPGSRGTWSQPLLATDEEWR